MPLSVAEFVSRWKINSQSERANAQTHFIDLCDMLDEPHPAAADSAGERYAFEKAIGCIDGGMLGPDWADIPIQNRASDGA